METKKKQTLETTVRIPMHNDNTESFIRLTSTDDPDVAQITAVAFDDFVKLSDIATALMKLGIAAKPKHERKLFDFDNEDDIPY